MSLTAAVLAAAVLGVDPISEVEPNQTRATATPALLGAAAAFTGTTRGFLDDPASVGTDTRDLWRVTLTANPLVIQRHTLQISTNGTQGHTGTVLGLQVNAGAVDPESTASLQSTSINTVPARYCAVYTLGNAQPWFLYRITGSAGTSSPYTVSVTTETVAPSEPFACPLNTGPITISTLETTTLNTKLFLFDGDTMAPIADGVNDDATLSPTSGSPQSRLVRNLSAGRYILAIANGGAVDDRPPPGDDRQSLQATWNLTESPGLLVNGSSTATGNFSVKFTDGLGEKPVVTVAKPGSYGIAFLRFSVAPYCGRADVGRQGGQVCHDGQLDNNDFVVFIDWFFRHDARANVGGVGGVPPADQVFDNNDWIVFIDQFFSGCTP